MSPRNPHDWTPKSRLVTDPNLMTWEDAERFTKAAGLDKEEYFSIHVAGLGDFSEENFRTMLIWDEKGIRHVAVWWAPGANEGYYVHVERQVVKGRDSTSKIAMLGKFWSPLRAAAAVDLLVRLFYGVYRDPNEIIAAAKKSFEDMSG
jgi:hypothetical protein